jgi:hypothetical protein
MPRVLIISPQAGFGNRMRALRSGIWLAVKTGRIPYHAWHKTTSHSEEKFENVRQMNCGFSEFFIGIPEATIMRFPKIDKCLSEWLPGEFCYSRQSSAQQIWNIANPIRPDNVLEQLRGDEDVVLLETSLDYSECMPYESTKIYKEFFIPKIECTNTYTLGFSFRRDSRFIYLFPEARATDEQLIEWFQTINKSLNPLSIIVSADSSEFLEKLRIEKNDWFTDFLKLSRCSIIFGTPKSSFAEEAALFGGVQYSRITAI